ncbi:MAG: hypothetical protein ABIG89_03165 [Candidatus Woesearchaeota archaeon]
MYKKTINKRSQIYSYELVLASAFIVVLFLMIAFTHYRYMNNVESNLRYDQMTQDASRIAYVMLNSGGSGGSGNNPADWEDSASIDDIHTFGLTTYPGEIKTEKISRLIAYLDNAQDRAKLKKKLGIASYQLNIGITRYLNYNVASNRYIDITGESHGDTITADTRAVVKRNAYYDGAPAMISFTVGK